MSLNGQVEITVASIARFKFGKLLGSLKTNFFSLKLCSSFNTFCQCSSKYKNPFFCVFFAFCILHFTFWLTGKVLLKLNHVQWMQLKIGLLNHPLCQLLYLLAVSLFVPLLLCLGPQHSASWMPSANWQPSWASASSSRLSASPRPCPSYSLLAH